jgi:hypothetical protein
MWVVIGLVASAGPARAGALNRLVGDLKHESGQDQQEPEKEPQERTRDHRGESPDSDSGSSGRHYDGGGGWLVPQHPSHGGFLVGAYPYPTTGVGTDVSLYAALHAVEASDGATIVTLRASYADLGIEIADTGYYERDERYPSSYLTMDVWRLGFAYRALAPGPDDRTALWLSGGLAGVKSAGLELLGGVVGAELAHNFTSSLGAECSARLFAFQDHIRALELRAGVAASVIRLSYRLLQFDVGPPLRGPEVGVALSF